MKSNSKSRLTLMAIIGSVLIAVLALTLVYLTDRTDDLNAAKILAAVRVHVENLEAQGLPVPETVRTSELIEAALLEREDTSVFTEMEVNLKGVKGQINPQDVLMRGFLSDGQIIDLLADGSVQQRDAASN